MGFPAPREPKSPPALLIRACRAGPRINPRQMDEVTPSHAPRTAGNPARSCSPFSGPPMTAVVTRRRAPTKRPNEAIRAMEPHALAPPLIRACRAGPRINPGQVNKVTPSNVARTAANPARLPTFSAALP